MTRLGRPASPAADLPGRRTDLVRVTVEFPRDAVELADRLADAEALSRADILRRVLRAWVATEACAERARAADAAAIAAKRTIDAALAGVA